MATPWPVIRFRDNPDPAIRREIYRKAGGLKAHIRRRFNLCIHCFNAPIAKGSLCRSCQPPRDPLSGRKSRLRQSLQCSQLPPQRRVCIGCEKLFTSHKGMNLCRPCVQAAREEVARLTLGRGANAICTRPTVVALYKKYGHAYKPSLIPRIPLSTVGVLEAL